MASNQPYRDIFDIIRGLVRTTKEVISIIPINSNSFDIEAGTYRSLNPVYHPDKFRELQSI